MPSWCAFWSLALEWLGTSTHNGRPQKKQWVVFVAVRFDGFYLLAQWEVEKMYSHSLQYTVFNLSLFESCQKVSLRFGAACQTFWCVVWFL